MPDVPIEDFLPLVLQHAPSLPVPLAVEHIRQAAATFCAETRCWRGRLSFAITGNPTAIPAPLNAIVHEIERAEFGGITLEPALPEDFTDTELTALPDAAGGPPRWITQENPDSVIILPAQTGTLTLHVFLKPSMAVVFGGDAARNTLPDFLHAHHGKFIACGALASALLLPDEAFNDQNRAQYFMQQFQSRIDAVRSEHRRGQQRRPLRQRRSAWV